VVVYLDEIAKYPLLMQHQQQFEGEKKKGGAKCRQFIMTAFIATNFILIILLN